MAIKCYIPYNNDNLLYVTYYMISCNKKRISDWFIQSAICSHNKQWSNKIIFYNSIAKKIIKLHKEQMITLF